jgi:hypothetical protein
MNHQHLPALGPLRYVYKTGSRARSRCEWGLDPAFGGKRSFGFSARPGYCVGQQLQVLFRCQALLLAAGPVVPDLTAADDHNVPGGVLGRLRNLGFSEHKVDHFEEALSDGATLVAVSLKKTDEEELLRGVLKRNDAQEVSST